MNEELKNLIDSEYDKIESIDTSIDYQKEIDKQISAQNTKIEKKLNNSIVVKEFLKKHNKNSFEELTQEEINELLRVIDTELESIR